jgi:putative membrane protein
MSMLDLHLAVAHHLLVFSLFGVLSAELISVRRGMAASDVPRLSRVDLCYGVLAGLILAVGFSRAVLAAKGWEYYSQNAFFWLKIATFAAIGILSIPPTITFLKWRRTGATPSDDQILSVRRFLWAETTLFAPLLGFAAAMARGYGQI